MTFQCLCYSYDQTILHTTEYYYYYTYYYYYYYYYYSFRSTLAEFK